MSALPRPAQREIARTIERMPGPDHRDSWKGMPPIRPGQPLREGRAGGPDPMPVPKASRK